MTHRVYRRVGKYHLKSSQYACPPTKSNPKANYPLNSRKRAVNAHARYNQRKTRKCKGGLAKIKRAERKFGVRHLR
jgi:hypothetical protein